MSLALPVPPFAPGRFVELEGRGRTWVRELHGPAGAPVLLLLHGWVATGALNWYTSMPTLAEHFRVLAMDLRGHGRGVRTTERWSTEADAADAVALLETLGVERAVVAGYSSGGATATVMARDRPDLVAGAVLCATTTGFPNGPVLTRALEVSGALVGAARRVHRGARAPAPEAGGMLERFSVGRALSELRLSDPRVLIEAAWTLGEWDSAAWLPQITVPTAVVMTTRDHDAPLADQRALRALIPGATEHIVEGDHMVIVRGAERFVPVLRDAVVEVAERAALLDPVAAEAARAVPVTLPWDRARYTPGGAQRHHGTNPSQGIA